MATFPTLVGRSLEGREIRIPEDLPKGPRILILAFRRWHTRWIETWEGPLKEHQARCPSLSVWEVPALSRRYLPGRRFIDGGMRAGIPDASAREHTLTVYTNLSSLAQEIGLPSLDTIYVLLLDSNGVVVWRGSGAADQTQLDLFRTAFDALACDG